MVDRRSGTESKPPVERVVWTGPIRAYLLWSLPKGSPEKSGNHTFTTGRPLLGGIFMPSLLSLLWRDLQTLWDSADHLLYHLATDFEYSLWSPLHTCLPYLRNIPYTKSAGFRIYTLGLHAYRRSSGCFYFSGIPWNLLHLSAAVFPLAYGYDLGSISPLWSLLLFFRSALLVFFLRPLLSFCKLSDGGTSAQILCDICICIC